METIKNFLFESWGIITAVCGVVAFFVGRFAEKGNKKSALMIILAIFCLLSAGVGLLNVRVPNVCGKTAAEAKQILSDKHLDWNLEGADNKITDLYKYKVIKQSHNIGELVLRGTIITVGLELNQQIPDQTERGLPLIETEGKDMDQPDKTPDSGTTSITPTPKPNVRTYYFDDDSVEFPTELKSAAYTGPGLDYYRAAKGKAQFNSEEFIYGGRTGNWIFVRCMVNNGHIRYGWIDAKGYSYSIRNVPTLVFSNVKTIIKSETEIWDSVMDPQLGPLGRFESETEATYLCNFNISGTTFAYVEASLSGQKVRGFVDLNDIY